MENLESRSWAFISFSKYKDHFCPRELVGDLITDIETRGGSTGEIKGVDYGFIDLPGMVSIDRPFEMLETSGFKLEIPSQDFEYFMETLTTAQIRKFTSGKEYYKIHGWLVCIVVTPIQREIILSIMEKMLPLARQRADDEDRRFQEVLEKINAGKMRVISWRDKKNQVPVPPKDKN